MKNIYSQLLDYHGSAQLPVIATVVRTRGSAPQVPGSSALFDDKGLVAGTVGGGAVEKKIQEISGQRFVSGNSGCFHFNLKNDISKKEEAICGGQITILVDAEAEKHLHVMKEMQASLNEQEPGVLLTYVIVDKEDNAVIDRYWVTNTLKPPMTDLLKSRSEAVVKEMLLRADPSSFCEADLTSETGKEAYLFFEPVFPPMKLVIAGAGHIGRALAHLGRLIGFEVTVVDDRPEYANSENIPDAAHIITDDVGKVMRGLPKGPDTYIVIVTRGHKDDAEALKACIASDNGYLGMIGSKSKIQAIREEFMSNGWATSLQWDAVHSPIGLEINSRTVEEIAISIAAELIMVKNGRKKKIKGCPA
ncbi:MAG TPA: XdhC family protein [Bacteroidales bacterium]|jgi:xanthine dehydrogenase accessory factor|nr:XdhC family protein [Bacteroidales bacterium]